MTAVERIAYPLARVVLVVWFAYLALVVVGLIH